MSFMQHQITFGEFWQADTRNEGIVSMPADMFSKAFFMEQYDVEDEENVSLEKGHFARLSAPGYMDCTEWAGPFATHELAEEYLQDMYGDDDEEDTF